MKERYEFYLEDKEKPMSKKDFSLNHMREDLRENLNADSSEDLAQIKEKYKDKPEELKAIDALQAALDIVGLEPTFWSLADGVNAVIYLFRSAKSAFSGDKDQSKSHLLDAGISAVSLIPFADVIKLMRLRNVPGLAKIAIKWARGLKTYAVDQKQKRVKKLIS